METPLTTEVPSAVETLSRQRAQIQGWLARLQEVGSDVPPHVAERVRADYEERLRAVTQELTGHRVALQGDLDARRAELERAEAHLASAADGLEEARLRHLIGEIEAGAWDEQRPELESAVAAAEAEAARVRGEAERLDALLREVDGGMEEPEPAVEAEPEPVQAAEPEAAGEIEAAPEIEAAAVELPPRDTSDDTIPEFIPSAAFGGENGGADEDLGDVDLSWLTEVEEVAAGSGEAAGSSEAAPAGAVEVETTTEDDLAFLEELDRAISASPLAGAANSPSASPGDPDRTLDADRAGMLLCKECGAINEPQLWYCEICGSEL